MSVLQYTNKGLDELISAKNQGIRGVITHVGAGTSQYAPLSTQEALKDERQRVPVADFEDVSGSELRVAARFDGDAEYAVGEVGFYLESGTLLAVYSAPGKTLTYKSPTTSWIQRFTLDLAPLPTDSVTVTVGVENINLMMTAEIASVSAATIDNMARNVNLMFRVLELEKR